MRIGEVGGAEGRHPAAAGPHDAREVDGAVKERAIGEGHAQGGALGVVGVLQVAQRS